MVADTGGCFNLVNVVVPHLKAAGGGSLVALIGPVVERVPVQDILPAAPKAAIEQLMRGIAKEGEDSESGRTVSAPALS